MSGKPLRGGPHQHKSARSPRRRIFAQVNAILGCDLNTTHRKTQSDEDLFENINMESVVKTLERMGYNPTEKLVEQIDSLSPQQQAKINQALAEMGQRELVAEKKEIKHEGLGLLDVLEAQARAQLSDESDD